MKSDYKQKKSTLQTIFNDIQSGDVDGGGDRKVSIDAYTKKESDDIFLSKKDAEGTYQTKSGMTKYAPLESAVPEVTDKDNKKVLRATYAEERKGQNGSFNWDAINEVPTITTNDEGKILTAHYFNATHTTSYSWDTPREEIPQVTSEDNRKVLTALYNNNGGSYAWITPVNVPDYSQCRDGDTLVVHETNGVRTLQWENYIPCTLDTNDIGKVLSVKYTSANLDVPVLEWKDILPDYSNATEGAVLTVKIVDGQPTLVWE